MKIFEIVLPCSPSQEFKWANSLNIIKKFIKPCQMLGSNVTFKKIKGSNVSDANKDGKLTQNPINIFLPKWPHATTTLHYI